MSNENLVSSFRDLQHALESRRHEKEEEKRKIFLRRGDASVLSDFMQASNEPITWIEAIELWRDMRHTNNSKLPFLETSIRNLINAQRQDLEINSNKKSSISSELLPVPTYEDGKSDHLNKECSTGSRSIDHACDEITPADNNSLAVNVENDEEEKKDYDLSSEEIVKVAKGIKNIYAIRQKDDKSELKFVIGSLVFVWIVTLSLVVFSQYYSNESLGKLTWQVLVEAVVLFIAELIWECVLSALVLKFDIKINYTRKLGNLFKVPKYFAADLLPFYESTATSLVAALAINQTLFCLIYYRYAREKIPFFSYIFLSQDRREDRPDTLIFQVTEDIMRFAIYFPFKILVANRTGVPALIFIPVAVNNIGDGLAEPIGVAFGRHKYSTTALYHKGKFFKSKFTRSYEGSSCVFITTLVVVAIYYNTFSTPLRFWITLSLLPLLMTIAEAKAPHTNDGPFLALVGCSFLSAVFLL